MIITATTHLIIKMTLLSAVGIMEDAPAIKGVKPIKKHHNFFRDFLAVLKLK